MPQKLDLQPIEDKLDLQPLDLQVDTSLPSNEPGNIDLVKQPKVQNPLEGGISTVYSRGFNLDGKEVLLPSVTPDGRFLKTDDEVINEYRKTGKHLGKFNTPEESNAYAEQLHKDYESGKYEPPPEKGWLRKAWDAISTPLTEKPKEVGQGVSDYITEPSLATSPTGQGGVRDYLAGVNARMKGFYGGAAEGVGNVVSDLTSPLNIALTLATAGEYGAGKAGLSQIARLMRIGQKAASIPVAAHGAYETFRPDASLGERGMGLVEMAGGAAPFVHGPNVTPELNVAPEITPEVQPQLRPSIADRINGALAEPPPIPERAPIQEPNPWLGETINDIGYTETAPIPQEIQFNEAEQKPLNWQTNETRRMRAGEEPISQSMDLKTQEPVPASKNAEPIIQRIKDIEPEQAGIIRELWNAPKGLMSVDLPFITSAALRQGLPMIGTKEWRQAWGPSIRSYGSPKFYQAHQSLLKSDPLMQRPLEPVLGPDGSQAIKSGRPMFREKPSIAEQAGVKLSDLGSLTKREEAIRSSLPERIPGYGKLIAASNRGYTAYVNDLRLNTFRNLYDAMPDKNNMVALKQLGDAVNTFTGKGPLKLNVPESSSFFGREVKTPGGGGNLVNLEKHAQLLNEALFSPQLIASRLQMLNPVNYVMTAPQVRKEYLKAALRTAGAWTTLAGLAQLTGAGSVTLDPRNTDFGKIKIGKLRMDPAGGFQQFLVLLSRLGSGESVSSTNPNKVRELGKAKGPYDPTYGSTMTDFISNKLHPSIKNFLDAAFASKGRPYNVMDRTLQMVLPMMSSDMIDIAKEEPELLPVIAPLISAGMGSQYYGKGDFSKPKITPTLGLENMDVTLGR